MRAIEFIYEATNRRGFLKGAGAAAASSILPKKAILSLLQNVSKVVKPQTITTAGMPTQYSVNEVIKFLSSFVDTLIDVNKEDLKKQGIDPKTATKEDWKDTVRWSDMEETKDTLQKLKMNKSPDWETLANSIYSYDTEFRDWIGEQADEEIPLPIMKQIGKLGGWGVNSSDDEETTEDDDLKSIEQQITSSGLTPAQLNAGISQVVPKLDDHMKYVASLISRIASRKLPNANPQPALPAPDNTNIMPPITVADKDKV